MLRGILKEFRLRMDKKSIAGIVIVALIFLGFTFYNSHQQKKYQEQLMAYNCLLYTSSPTTTVSPQIRE